MITKVKKQMNKIPELKEKILKQAKSEALGKYIWKHGVGPEMGYAFSRIHALAYSFIGVQTLYIATHWNPIYWDTACLIVNSGSLENNSGENDDENEDEFSKKRTASTDYGKIAKAMGEMKSAGISVSLVDINRSSFSFKPDAKNNKILYGLKGLLNVSDTVIDSIIKNRPYESPKDFYEKVKPNKQAMISLIKGGAFDNMIDRKLCMGWFIWETCDKKKRITLQNMNGLISHNLLPEDTEERVQARRIYEFNRYLKAVCLTSNKLYYKLDNRALNFINECGYEDILHQDSDGNFFCYPKDWDKYYQKWMDVFRDWIAADKDKILQNLNEMIFKEDWNKYATGTISAWEMETLCFYYHDHELKNVNMNKYGLSDFSKLPENPIVEKSFSRGGKIINMFKLSKICGTCIEKNKAKSTVSLLTTSGVVSIKFRKEYFALFDKQISEIQEDGTKKVAEKSWFNRGNMIIVMGMRSGDDFIVKKYASTPGHELYHIEKVYNNGNIEIKDGRYNG